MSDRNLLGLVNVNIPFRICGIYLELSKNVSRQMPRSNVHGNDEPDIVASLSLIEGISGYSIRFIFSKASFKRLQDRSRKV
jgi:hypothetical protein